MRTLCINKDSYLESCDRIAIAFGCLYKPLPNNGIDSNGKHKLKTEPVEDTKVLNGESSIIPEGGESCQYVIFNPIDFNYFILRTKRMQQHFDRETQQRLVKRGIVGYLWGATVVLDKGVVMGHCVVTSDIREKALKSKKSIIVELEKFDKISEFEGIAETHTVWPLKHADDEDETN